ncbi:MAG: hypothetical protein H6738_23285 [Alphaproteobacteria bacterium]|nr:hypothetical protein [Alphaproteobacteria bacterium]MCB9699729.1 hypothetical protein [Alphaproteobacteria bacterium]
MWWLAWFACGDAGGDGPVGRGDDDDDVQTGDTGLPTPSTFDRCPWLGSTPLRPVEGCVSRTLAADVTVTDLVIEPGTVLEVAPGVVLRVEGSLDASGTAERPIVLRAIGAPWGGLALAYEPYTTTYDNYGDQPPDSATRFVMHHVEVRDAGAGTRAAITVDGGYTTCGFYDCIELPSTILARELAIRGSVSGGVAGDGALAPDDPVGFEDVAGTLVDIRASSLDDVLVEDLGGNAHVAIHTTPVRGDQRWVSQGVPIEVTSEVRVRWFQGPRDVVRDVLTIEPNVVLLDGGGSFVVDGGRIEASGVTFAPLGSSPWPGIRTLGDHTGYDASEVNGIGLAPSELELTDCVVRGTTNPAVDWREGHVPPTMSGTTVEEVTAEGTDPTVCVVACGSGLTAPALGNTFTCDVPVVCPPG